MFHDKKELPYEFKILYIYIGHQLYLAIILS